MRPNIIVACDSFKGCLSSANVGDACREGILEYLPHAEVIVIPIADGGEGTVEAVVSAADGVIVECRVFDAIMRPVTASYGIVGDTAIIEMAKANGLAMISPEDRNPLIATSFGTGQMIDHALKSGFRKFIIGLGGSATNDGGVGMLKALGYRFLDNKGNEIGNGAGALMNLSEIDGSKVNPMLEEAVFKVASDVTNPLLGNRGASYVFGPQKGADSETVNKLEEALSIYSRVVYKWSGINNSSVRGAGAAGGMGFAFISFLGGKLESGIDMILDIMNFNEKLSSAHMIITGEGRIDSQSSMGKAISGIMDRAKVRDVPVIAICGSLEQNAVSRLLAAGLRAVFPIIPGPVNLCELMKPEAASANIRRTVNQIIRLTTL